ncbi:MAG: chemotaxis protein CheW, partial [Pseudomonadota bacterium]
ADGGNARDSDGRRAERGATPSPPAGPGRSAGARDSRAAASEGPGAVAPFLTFTAGGATCALPAVAVHATVPRCQIEQNALTSGLCIGSITYHRQRIPVVRTADLIGLGEPDDRTNAEIVVLRCEGDDRLGFAVDTINRMIRIEERTLQPPPAAASGHEGLLKGVLTFPGSADQIFVLDEARLAKNDTVAELAKLSRPQKATQKSEATLRKPNGDVVEERVRHLVFDVGISVASPVMQVLRIVTPPERVVARPSSDVPGLRGIFSLDGRPVPLVDLDQMLGLWGTGDGDARVLVVERGADLVGFAVHAVTGIETSAWKRTAPAGTPDQGAAVVQLGRGAERHVLPVLDLQRLAGEVVA